MWDGFIYILEKVGNVAFLSDQRPIVHKALLCEGQFFFKDFDFIAWVCIPYFLVFRVRPIVSGGLYKEEVCYSLSLNWGKIMKRTD